MFSTHTTESETIDQETIAESIQLLSREHPKPPSMEMRYGCGRKKIEKMFERISTKYDPDVPHGSLLQLYGIPVIEDSDIPIDQIHLVDADTKRVIYVIKLV